MAGNLSVIRNGIAAVKRKLSRLAGASLEMTVTHEPPCGIAKKIFF